QRGRSSVRIVVTYSYRWYLSRMEPRETLTISLPAALRERVDAIVRSGDYGNVSEYFRELVRQDLRRRADHQLEINLLKALDCGKSAIGRSPDSPTIGFSTW